jgi:hypothetical protein
MSAEEVQQRWAAGAKFTVRAPNNTLLNLNAADVTLTIPCGCQIVIEADVQTTKWECPHHKGTYRRA